jgi:Uma2 family endonuclease
MAERTKIGMSLDEFMARFEEQPFELINGEIHPLPIEIKRHAIVRNKLFKILLKFERETNFGEAFSRQLYLKLDEDDYVGNAYYPDVILIKQNGINFDDDKPLLIAPDLVVEVISPTDKYTDVNTKVDAYLLDGVKLIWIVDPQRKTIAVYEGSDTGKIIRADDTLTGGNVLPDFEVSVKAIFNE